MDLQHRSEWTHSIVFARFMTRMEEAQLRDLQLHLRENIIAKRAALPDSAPPVKGDEQFWRPAVTFFDAHFRWAPGEYTATLEAEVGDKGMRVRKVHIRSIRSRYAPASRSIRRLCIRLGPFLGSKCLASVHRVPATYVERQMNDFRVRARVEHVGVRQFLAIASGLVARTSPSCSSLSRRNLEEANQHRDQLMR